MQTRQTIAVIGATGNMGSAIAKSLSRGNYRLLLIARQQEALTALANEIRAADADADVEAIGCSHEACWEADIIISAVPHVVEQEVAEKIRDVANQKIVISIANPLNETYDALTTPRDSSAAEELQRLLPNARVVKAFNTTYATAFAEPAIDGHRVDAFIAGNDDDSLQTVSELVATAGFNPVIAGDLSASRTLEQMQLLLIRLDLKQGQGLTSGWKILRR